MKLHKLFMLIAGVCSIIPAFSAEPEMRYIDAATLTVIGKALPTEQAYNRIDTNRYHFSEARVAAYCYRTPGIAIVFRTDSRTIRARWETTDRHSGANMTAVAQKGLDLYIRRGTAWVYAGIGTPTIDGKNDRHDATLIANMPQGEKECLLYLPLFDCVGRLEIGIEEGSSIAAMENPFRHKIVIHGSSITHGASAGRAGMSYPALLGRHTGLYCINLGYSGLCTMQPEFAAYLADVDADAFIFDSFSNPSAAMINERFDAFVDVIRKSHPTTPLIFLQTIKRESRNFNTRTEQFEAEKQAAAEAQVRERMKSDKHIYFIDPGNLLGKDHNATVDGSHPSDLGFERMLAQIEPPIVKILQKYNIR